jgi:4-hydroxybenzoate polyprenyltransferase
MTETSQQDRVSAGAGRVADAPADNLVDRYLPAAAMPFARLARFDRPIGGWLLMFPCWWGQLLAERATGAAVPSLWFLALFLIGSFVMRGAGCTYNDVVDRDFDARVARTASRPIPSGAVSVGAAFGFACALSLVGLAVLVQFNSFTIWLGMGSLLLVALYPFAKRYTFWPQLVLGLTFKWGALVGWAAITGSLALPALLLYVGSVQWTIGYDTIYAHQDKEDDALLGLKSTALRFGERTLIWVGAFYAGALALWVAAVTTAGAGAFALIGLTFAAAQMMWQLTTLEIDNGANCLTRFKSNTWVGWAIALGLAADIAFAARFQ